MKLFLTALLVVATAYGCENAISAVPVTVAPSTTVSVVAVHHESSE